MADCGTLTIEAAFDASLVDVVSCGLSSGSVGTNDSVTFSATVENQNDVEATVSIEWVAGGTTITSDSFTINGNSQKTVQSTISYLSLEGLFGAGTTIDPDAKKVSAGKLAEGATAEAEATGGGLNQIQRV